MGPHSPGPSDNHPLCPLIAPSTVDFTMAQYTFDSSLFSQTMNNSAMTSTPLPPPSVEAMPTTIKMEMIENYDHSPSPAHHSSNSSEASHTPAPESNGSKPVKKRKSWGQVPPEPKTSLPPRKRAKTEDEKEQRRIERVKRNRLAAHNSRERKRQETEHLQQQKDALEAEMNSLREKAALKDKYEAELKRWHNKYPGDVAEMSSVTFTFNETADTVNPSQTSAPPYSPISVDDSMDSPRDSSCQPETPASTFEATPEFDLTQYPAAMLCDLQCQSASGMASPMAAILAYLTLFNLYIQSMKSLLSSTTSSTSTSSLRALFQWNPALAWLITMTSSDQPSFAPAQLQTITAFLTALMQSSLTCRVPLAHLLVATRLSQQTTSFENVIRPGSEKSETGSVDDVRKSRMMRSSRLRQLGRRKGVQS